MKQSRFATVRSWILRPSSLWVLLVGAFALRAALVIANYMGLTVNHHTDTDSYVSLSHSFFEAGGAFDMRTPGYPLFLALAGPDLNLALAWQGLMGFAACLVVYLAVRAHAGELGGRLALAFVAVDLATITYGNLVLSECLFGALLTLALAFAPIEGSKWRAVGCGVLLASATYVRPVGLLLGFLWPAWMLAVWKKPRRALLVFATVWMLLLPWFFWQKAHHGVFRFSAITRINLLLYHAAYVAADVEGRPAGEVQHEFAQLPRSEWNGRAIEILSAHPLTYLKLAAEAVPMTLLSPAWHAFQRMLPGWREWQYTIAGVAAAFFWIWMPFSLMALRKPFALFALATAAYLIFIPGPQGRSRFRAPAVPALAMAAGMGMACLLETEKSERPDTDASRISN